MKNIMKDGLNILDNGDKYWYKNDKIHRDNGKPAFRGQNGEKHWYKEGKIHRLDGPAMIGRDYPKRWFYEGKWIEEVSSQKEFEDWLKYKSFL